MFKDKLLDLTETNEILLHQSSENLKKDQIFNTIVKIFKMDPLKASSQDARDPSARYHCYL